MRIVAAVLVTAFLVCGAFAQAPVPVYFPDPGHPTFWYGGSVIFECGSYTAWITVNDAILRFTSSDGVFWLGGQRVLEATAPWENDGMGLDAWGAYQHGVSNACVLHLPGGYVMGYSAGPILGGGVGLAYSLDGVNWTRDAHNPIYSVSGLPSLALSAVSIHGIPYLYFSSNGGVFRLALNSSGAPAAAPEVTTYPASVYPVAWDDSGCWMVKQGAWVGLAPGSSTLYGGGDCVSMLGIEAGTFNAALSGHAENMMPFLMTRGPTGYPIRAVPIFLYSAGDAWATWQLQAAKLEDPNAERTIKRRLTSWHTLSASSLAR
jgi:hypothetical protein